MKVTIHQHENYPADTCSDINLGGLTACRIKQNYHEGFTVFSFVTDTILSSECKTMEEALQVVRDHLDEQFSYLEWNEESVTHGCSEIKHLLDAELEIFRKHLGRHKWFQHITDEQLAAMDFAKKYGWVMKELYCLHACRKRKRCAHAIRLQEGAIEENPFGLEK